MLYEIELYEIDENNLYRFSLGKISENTLFVFGVNPSTASDKEPDNTINRVMGFAEDNGYSSFVMFNLYPYRATNSDELPQQADIAIIQKNVEYIYQTLQGVNSPHILLAWGETIYKRDYLLDSLKHIYNKLSSLDNVRWLRIGDMLKCNQPRHPLYANSNLSLDEMDMDSYYQQFLADKTEELSLS